MNAFISHFKWVIGLIGLMLIYGAFSEVNRRMALVVAVLSELAFIALVLTFGRQFLQFPRCTNADLELASEVPRR